MNRPVLSIVIGAALLVLAVIFIFAPSKPTPKPSPAPERSRASAAPPDSNPVFDIPMPSAPAAAKRSRPESATAAAPAPPVAAPEAPSPDAGTLTIDADVPGAQVFLDRVFLGAAPVTAPNVARGSHTINVSAQGYEGYSETIDVAPGPRTVLVKFKEVRLDARIDVVHKHGIGSCKGRLLATPQGLKYETTDKGDAFSAALNDLESFEIDYLKKNLKVQLRKGRKYDFTDPEGNADRLFVFHRDVSKARDRLAKGDK